MEKFKQLILNPVENLPFLVVNQPPAELHGMYVSDKEKTDEIMKASKIAFSGRDTHNLEVRSIYAEWAKALDVKHLSMRLLSGLHAHTVLFMGLGNIGDTIMLLPEEAGGHFSTKKILTRLGYHIIDVVPDHHNFCIDIEATLKLIYKSKPKFLFVDRSEGIHYEDFSPLFAKKIPWEFSSVFDASQYLTNILNDDFISPFDMGFDIMISTMHKNLPGPQKALVCSRDDNLAWNRIEIAMSDYVSSLHVDTTYVAGYILKEREFLKLYSKRMIENSINLENELYDRGLPIVKKNKKLQATHHIWIATNDKDYAYGFFERMELCGLLVNYRKLPYGLGMGIRMGTSAATLQGINEQNINRLSELITNLYQNIEVTDNLYVQCQEFISNLRPMISK